MALIDLVGGSNYLAVSRELCAAIGPGQAILYAELIDQYRFWDKCGKLDDQGMFFSTVEQIQSRTGLSKDQQPRYFQTLTKLGLICAVRKGIPAKRYIKVHENPKFLRDLYTKDLDEARNNQKSQNPATSNWKTRQQETGKSSNKPTENPAVTNLYITNHKTNNTDDVVEIFSKYGIDVRPVLRKYPGAFVNFSEKDLVLIASTIAQKQNEGLIGNPVGLLMSNPSVIADSILAGQFYSKPNKKAKKYNQDEYEIYVRPLNYP
jgi:hypothetical protein